MTNTLQKGDRVLVRKWPRRAPARGEIVAFHYPLNRQQSYIKRVVGVPGDRIRIVNKVVYLNGAALPEPYAIHTTSFIDAYRDNFPSLPSVPLPPAATRMLQQNVSNGEVVVPNGNYFVLGDNRDDSSDSRYWGFVPAGDLIGKAFLIYASASPANPERVRLGFRLL